MSGLEFHGFNGFAAELSEWAAQMEDPDMTSAKKNATRRAREEFIDLIQDNIDTIPHNLQALRQSWKYASAKHGEVEVWTEKEYAPAFEYGAAPYDIEGHPLAFPAQEWDNPAAKERFGLEDGDMAYFNRVRHPGFNAYFYFTNAFLEMSEGGVFEDIVEEEFMDELEEAFD